uniref:CBM21 domain-containing protein n=1 Tax=Plectus sambesii TaxID=2011161 RepID=A0A914WD62_9BILA
MCSKDEDLYFDSDFDLNDCDLELRLKALSALVSTVCFRKENKSLSRSPRTKLIIKPRPPAVKDHLDYIFNDPTEHTKPPSPSVLKSPNSPSSGLKKSVRFADAVGRDLELIKTFKNEATETDDDEPLSVMRRVRSFQRNSSPTATSTLNERRLLRHFEVRSKQDVKRIVEEQNVCIESINSHGMCISGFVQVKNVAFEKQVRLRYTLDNWVTYAELPCSFSFSSLVDNHDFFCFSFCVPFDLPVGSNCKMCVQFSADGQNYWDNNNGDNYNFECCSEQSVPDINNAQI